MKIPLKEMRVLFLSAVFRKVKLWRSCDQLWVQNLRLSGQLKWKDVIKSQQMRSDVTKPVSINLGRIIPYANRKLIHLTLANRFVIRLKRFYYKRFNSFQLVSSVSTQAFLFEWSKFTFKKLDGKPCDETIKCWQPQIGPVKSKL